MKSPFMWFIGLILAIWIFSDDKDSKQITSTAYSSSAYTCTDDCSGHEAGSEWAVDNGIMDPDECDGDSESFNQGCRKQAMENNLTDDYRESWESHY